MEANSYQFNPTDYATYRFRITHNNGKMTMSVLARDEAHGRQRIRNNEDCPDSAIETLLSSPMKKTYSVFKTGVPDANTSPQGRGKLK